MFTNIGDKIEKDMKMEGKIITVVMVVLLVAVIYSLGYMAA